MTDHIAPDALDPVEEASPAIHSLTADVVESGIAAKTCTKAVDNPGNRGVTSEGVNQAV